MNAACVHGGNDWWAIVVLFSRKALYEIRHLFCRVRKGIFCIHEWKDLPQKYQEKCSLMRNPLVRDLSCNLAQAVSAASLTRVCVLLSTLRWESRDEAQNFVFVFFFQSWIFNPNATMCIELNRKKKERKKQQRKYLLYIISISLGNRHQNGNTFLRQDRFVIYLFTVQRYSTLYKINPISLSVSFSNLLIGRPKLPAHAQVERSMRHCWLQRGSPCLHGKPQRHFTSQKLFFCCRTSQNNIMT